MPSDLFHPWVRYCYRSDGDEKDALDKPEERGIEVRIQFNIPPSIISTLIIICIFHMFFFNMN